MNRFYLNHVYKRILGIFLVLTGIFFQSCTRREGPSIDIGKKESLFSHVLKEERTLLISLPQDYETSTKKYPVLYVLDADFLPYFARVVGTVGMESFMGNIPEMIIVGIKNVDRDRDMFPVSIDSRPSSGGAGHFMRFLSEELIPHIEDHYRTEKFRLLYGASNAGLFVVHCLLSRPELFDAVLAISPMVGWCFPFIAEEAQSLFDSRKSLDAFLFIIYGSNDLSRVTKAVPYLEKILKENSPEDFKWCSRVVENEGHVPYVSLLYGLNFVFDGWNFPPKEYETATLESIQAYYQKLSNRYGFGVSIPMVVYLETGNKLRQRGKIQKAIKVFEANLEQYPSDPNALFYLGEGYWDDNQKEKAIQYYKKALEIDPDYSPASQKLKSMEK